MKLPIAGQRSRPTRAYEGYAPLERFPRCVMVLNTRTGPAFPGGAGLGAPVLRIREAPAFERKPWALAGSVAGEEISGPRLEVAAALRGTKAVLLGPWVAEWAEVAARVLISPAPSRPLPGPWDLVLSEPRPKVLGELLRRIP